MAGQYTIHPRVRARFGSFAWTALPAFSLIELLVVMGIMALLIGLVMPALGRARETGRRTACLSNIHQIAIGLTTYLGDNNGILPYVLPLGNGGIGGSNGDEKDLLGELHKYVTRDEVFSCPADDTGVAIKLGSSYDYWPGWIMWARELFRGDSPSTVARVVTVFYQQTPGKWPVMADAETWHSELDPTGKNASFWDGSVAPLTDWSDPGWVQR